MLCVAPRCDAVHRGKISSKRSNKVAMVLQQAAKVAKQAINIYFRYPVEDWLTLELCGSLICPAND